MPSRVLGQIKKSVINHKKEDFILRALLKNQWRVECCGGHNKIYTFLKDVEYGLEGGQHESQERYYNAFPVIQVR